MRRLPQAHAGDDPSAYAEPDGVGPAAHWRQRHACAADRVQRHDAGTMTRTACACVCGRWRDRCEHEQSAQRRGGEHADEDMSRRLHTSGIGLCDALLDDLGASVACCWWQGRRSCEEAAARTTTGSAVATRSQRPLRKSHQSAPGGVISVCWSRLSCGHRRASSTACVNPGRSSRFTA